MTAIQVATAGLDTEAVRFVRSAVDTYLSGAGWHYVSRPDKADILLVDLDTSQGQSAWTRLNGSATPVRIAVSTESDVSAAAVTLAKPLRYRTLLNALRRAASRPGPEAGEGEATDRPSAFDPREHLLGVVQSALDGSHPVSVQHPRFPNLVIDPQSRRWAWGGDGDALAGASRAPAAEFHVRPCRPPQGLRYTAGEELLYTAALHGSRGRPMAGSDPASPVRLRRWPDFARLPSRPIHLRLAAYLTARSADAETAAEQTGAPIEDVHDFLNACRVVGLLDEAEASAAAPATGGADESLLARIRMRLWRGAGKRA